ncbi:hypothetical protein [Desulfonatronum sp. SC1]|uniref:hypothetical protein n=1 Tax=Desulfonatronum sp. SC1 TaxID=2109626 RepID=UPI000D3094A1|nr:hypothetical protein [Desulfonatronum sp. SC1]PTN35146.1 hypothetical protein C6366_11540 [Desulfonatronum sp. SC1]
MNSKLVVYLTVLVAVLFVWILELPAGDVKAMERQVSNDLRRAEGLFFSGKFEDTDSMLGSIEEMINKIKQQDPDNVPVRSLEQRLNRQRADLSRRWSGPETEKKSVEAEVQASPPSSIDRPADLPRNTRQAVRDLDRAIGSIETSDKDRLSRLKQGHNLDRLDTILADIQSKLDNLPVLFEQVQAAADGDGASDHPDIGERREKIKSVVQWAGQEMSEVRSQAEQRLAGTKSAEQDADALRTIYQEYDAQYFSPVNNLSYEHAVEKIIEAFNLFEKYSADKGRIEKMLVDFESKYGDTRQQVDQSTGDMAHGRAWENLKRAMDSMDQVPARLAQGLKSAIDLELEMLPRRHDFYRLERHEEIGKLVSYQKKYAPQEPGMGDIDAVLASDLKQFEQAIDRREWPACQGNISDRQGALDYFKQTWGQNPDHNYQVLGTVITGEWSVQERDLTGRPVMYGLPVLLAVQKPEDRAKGLARVFILTVRTPESASPEMKPPFTSDTVGDSYFVRAKKIK